MGLVEDRGLPEQVSDVLIDWIKSSQLKPGERLIENELAEEMGVSRTPIREAMKGLAEKGFVTTVPRRGVFVAEINGQRLREILDLRYLFELFAVQRGIEGVSQQDLREMHGLIAECELLIGDPDGFVRFMEKSFDFHRLIVRTSGTTLLSQFYDRLVTFLQIAMAQLPKPGPRSVVRSHQEHKTIVAAYEARDQDLLLQILGSHLNRSRNKMLELAAS